MASPITHIISTGLSTVAPLVIVFSMFQTAQAEVYKVIDSETGNVVYTDKPQSFTKNPNATITVDRVEMQSPPASTSARRPMSRNGYQPNQGNQNNQGMAHRLRPTTLSGTNKPKSQNNTPSQKNTKLTTSTKSPHYQVNILNPSEARAYHKPSQSVNVTSSVTPELENGDYIIVLIDGKEMATGTNVNITTAALEVGEHELTARVINKYGRELVSSNRIFHVIQRNFAIKKMRKKAADIAKYNALPWYKKVTIKNPAFVKTELY